MSLKLAAFRSDPVGSTVTYEKDKVIETTVGTMVTTEK